MNFSPAPSVRTSYLAISVRSILRIAPASAVSTKPTKLFEGAPLLVFAPIARNSMVWPVTGSTAMSTPLAEWFSAERGRPRISAKLSTTAPVFWSSTTLWSWLEFESIPW